MHHSRTVNRSPKYWTLLGLGFALSVCLSAGVQAQTTAGGDTLSPFEQSLFSHDYAGEPLAGRLGRLESSVFGEIQTGSEAYRRVRLLQALNAARNVIPSAPKSQAGNPPPDSSQGINSFNPLDSNSGTDASQGANSDDTTSSGSGNNSSAGLAPPPGDSDYPTVTALEREVFSRDFIRDDISRSWIVWKTGPLDRVIPAWLWWTG